jgi:multiple sugar transport system permease protein
MSEQLASVPHPTARELAVPRHAARLGPRPFNPSGLGAMTVLVIFAIYFLIPFFWLLVASTKNQGDLFGTFGLWFAPNFNLFSNLQLLFTYDDSIYLQWLLNTVIYAGGGAIVGTFIASMAGYAIAKYLFPGRNLSFSLVLGAILVPSTVLALPLYLLMSNVGLSNTYWSVLLPSMVSPFGVYLSRIYAAASVPDELLEASRIDGAGEFRTYTIAVRLMVPALVTIFLFQFVGIWNNFFLPLVMLSDDRLFPMTVGLQLWNANSEGTSLFLSNLVVCGSLVSAIPLLIGCLILQRYWRGGLGAGSVKG